MKGKNKYFLLWMNIIAANINMHPIKILLEVKNSLFKNNVHHKAEELIYKEAHKLT